MGMADPATAALFGTITIITVEVLRANGFPGCVVRGNKKERPCKGALSLDPTSGRKEPRLCCKQRHDSVSTAEAEVCTKREKCTKGGK
jgi:hypothetical protein